MQPLAKRALTRLDPDFGPGMFHSEEVVASIQLAQREVADFIKRRGDDWLRPNNSFSPKNIENSLLDISRHYFSDKEFDQAISISAIQKDLKLVEKALFKASQSIKMASPECLSALRALLRKEKSSNSAISKDDLRYFTEKLAVLIAAVKTINAVKSKKIKKMSFENACGRAIKLCEKITKRKFTSTYALARLRASDRTEHARFEFTHGDPEFVYAVMRGLEPGISASKVRTGLRDASRRRKTLLAAKSIGIAS